MLLTVPQLSPDKGDVYAEELLPNSEKIIDVLLPDSNREWARLDCSSSVLNDLLIGGQLEIKPNYCDLYLGLTSNTIINYSSLSFGFSLENTNGTVLEQENWPPANTRYVSSDQKYLLTKRIFYTPATKYNLNIWSFNAGELFSSTWSLVTPRPMQPYTSWTWNGTVWEAPTPMPTEDPASGFYWRWDEPSLSWVQEPFN